MEEVTEWDNHPREMWVWDADNTLKFKRKVLAFVERTFPVLALAENGRDVAYYKHCAEIEPQCRMTNREFARWLRERADREWRSSGNSKVSSVWTYTMERQDDPVGKDVLVREGGGDWHEPLIEE